VQQHNGYWISGTAVPGPPYTDYWESLATVCRQGRGSSIVEVARLKLTNFELDMQELAEYFGLEVARLIVDECFLK